MVFWWVVSQRAHNSEFHLGPVRQVHFLPSNEYVGRGGFFLLGSQRTDRKVLLMAFKCFNVFLEFYFQALRQYSLKMPSTTHEQSFLNQKLRLKVFISFSISI